MSPENDERCTEMREIATRLGFKATRLITASLILSSTGVTWPGAIEHSIESTPPLLIEVRAVSQTDLQIEFRNEGNEYIYFNQFILPEPWKNAVNFPASVLFLEVRGPEGELRRYVGDGSAGLLDPRPPCFCELLLLAPRRSYSVRASLTVGVFAYDVHVGEAVSVRAIYVSRTRVWYERYLSEISQADKCRSRSEASRIFDGQVESNGISVTLADRKSPVPRPSG